MSDSSETEIYDWPMGSVRTHEQITAEWLNEIETLGMTAADLANYMIRQGGDYRKPDAILRGIQRMMAGSTRVSGEMRVIVRILLRQYFRLKAAYGNVQWLPQPNGVLKAQIGSHIAYLTPQTRGRWLVSCQSPSGFSPTWERWQPDLESAKRAALRFVEESQNEESWKPFEFARWEAQLAKPPIPASDCPSSRLP